VYILVSVLTSYQLSCLVTLAKLDVLTVNLVAKETEYVYASSISKRNTQTQIVVFLTKSILLYKSWSSGILNLMIKINIIIMIVI